MVENSEWIPVAQLLLTALLGLGAASIAYRQYRTAKHKLTLDLFEHRFQIYDEVMAAADAAVKHKFEQSHLDRLHLAHAKARFLFREDVQKYIWIMIGQAATLLTSSEAMANKTYTDETLAKHAKAISDANHFFYLARDEFPQLCMRYMRMHQRSR